MKIWSGKTWLLALAFAAAPAAGNAQNLIDNGDAERGLENWEPSHVEISSANPHAGQYCFKTRAQYVIGKAVIPVDADKTYQYSGWFRSADGKTPLLLLGLMPLDAEKRQINPQEVNPVAGTETELLAACGPEDTVIKVKNASSWRLADNADVIAFDILDDYQDLPNRNTSPVVTKITSAAGGWELTLDKPCGRAWPAGARIRQHRYDSTFMYQVIEKFHRQEWTRLNGEIKGTSKYGAGGKQFWRGTRYVQIVLVVLGEGSVFCDDFSLAEQDAKTLTVPPLGYRPGGIMDFEFTGVNGKSQVTDRTGNYTMFSDRGALLEEHGALRTAFGARLRIPCGNHAFGETFTISAWVLKSSRDWLYHTPILGRGYQEPGFYMSPLEFCFDFEFYIDIRLPGFGTRFGGLRTTGYYYNMNIEYLDRRFSKINGNMPVALNQWQHLAGVYDHGAVRLYLNGELIAENPRKTQEPLLTSNCDLYLGAYRVKGETDNKVAAEMLIKSLRVDGRALSGDEIAAVYRQEKTIFPQDQVYPEPAETRQYFPPDMLALDPEMKTRLRQTAAYAEKIATMTAAEPKTATARVETTPGSLSFILNGERTAPVSAHGYINDNLHRLSEFVADFAAAGINMNALGMPASFWKGEGEYDWSEMTSRFDACLKANPESRIMVTIGTDAPAWFRDNYPEELEEYYADWRHPEAGKKRWTGYGGPMGSDKYLQVMCRMLHDVVTHIEQSKYANYVYGYHFSGGDAGEWYWPGQFAGNNTATGYSDPTRDAFRNYLRQSYRGDVSGLRRAWGDPAVTFETAEIPEPKERYQGENYFFRDPVRARRVIDCRRFMQHRNLLNVAAAAETIRKAAGNDKLLTTYYGYSMLYCGAPALAFSGLQTVRDVMKNTEIDFIAAPIDYGSRRGGDPGAAIAGFTGSAQLYGKGIWREEDLRTHLHTRLDNGRTANLRETNEVIRRAYGYTMAENYGMWYICQFGLHGYHQDEIMEDSARMKKIADEAARIERKDTAEVALIFDEKDSLDYLTPDPGYNQFVVASIWETYLTAHKMGAPFKVYFVEDLADPRMPDYKLYIFLNQWSVNTEQMKMIKAKIGKGNAVSLWIYAPGYLDGKKFSTANMEQLTGFKFEEFREMREVGGGMKFAAGSEIGGGTPAPQPRKAGPFFSVPPQDGCRILASWDNGRFNSVAVKEMKDRRSVWTLLPPSREMLTGLCGYAGVHLYSRGGETLLANDAYLMMIAPETGPFSIDLPAEREVTDCIEDVSLGNLKTIKGNFAQPGTTKIFRLK